MAKVIQHLWFEKDMQAAIGLYTSLVPGSSIEWIRALPADTPSGPAGSVLIASFTLGDQRYMAIEAGPLDPFNHSFSIMVECDEQGEIDRLWAGLLEGGSAEQCGWLRDRWGPGVADRAEATGRADGRSRSGCCEASWRRC